MTDITSTIGILVGIISIAYNVPFTYRIVKNKSARDVDLYFLLMRILGTAGYIVYGALIDDIYIIGANVFPMFCTIVIVTIKCRYNNRRVTWKEVHHHMQETKEKYELSQDTEGWNDFKQYVSMVDRMESEV
jgi:MtN3 and saliva related transmembrane protein